MQGHLSLGGLILAIVLGSVVGSALVVVPHLSATAGSQPTGVPEFSFFLTISNSSHTGTNFTYALAFVWLKTPNSTTLPADWTQFRVYSASNQPGPNVTVVLKSSEGVQLALFNSSHSSWPGPYAGGVLVSPSMGGWDSGGNAVVNASVTFAVDSSTSLEGLTIAIGASLPLSPPPSASQSILVGTE
jgi:hypothetical protein